MKAFIHKCNTISVFDSMEIGILMHIGESFNKELIQPDYKEIIPVSHLRRMSKVVRMGVGTALKVMHKNNAEGIIVGSGGGCSYNTMLFIKEYIDRETGILSPNAFIQSTDNTIAGQIAIILKNNSYNITYIQKGLAFENALIDAILLSNEHKKNVLVGGVDEWINIFKLSEELKEKYPTYWIGEGASFFILNQQEKSSLAKIAACEIIQASKKVLNEKVNTFLEDNVLSLPDLILYGNSFINHDPFLENIFDIATCNYSNHCGIYFTNSAFGTQLATEILSNPQLAKAKGLSAKNILVINNFYDSDWGLTYLSAV